MSYFQQNEQLNELHKERHQRREQQPSKPKTYTIKQASAFSSLMINEWPGLELGTVIWPGASVLANFLQQNSQIIHNKRVLELGSGLGLPGLVASVLGAKEVVLTDQKNLVSLMQHNIDMNLNILLGKVSCVALDWPNVEENLRMLCPFDVLLGSDIVYNNNLTIFDALLRVIQILSNDKTIIYLSYRKRDDNERYFFDHLTKMGWHVDHVQTVTCDDQSQQTIYKIFK